MDVMGAVCARSKRDASFYSGNSSDVFALLSVHFSVSMGATWIDHVHVLHTSTAMKRRRVSFTEHRNIVKGYSVHLLTFLLQHTNEINKEWCGWTRVALCEAGRCVSENEDAKMSQWYTTETTTIGYDQRYWLVNPPIMASKPDDILNVVGFNNRWSIVKLSKILTVISNPNPDDHRYIAIVHHPNWLVSLLSLKVTANIIIIQFDWYCLSLSFYLDDCNINIVLIIITYHYRQDMIIPIPLYLSLLIRCDNLIVGMVVTYRLIATADQPHWIPRLEQSRSALKGLAGSRRWSGTW